MSGEEEENFEEMRPDDVFVSGQVRETVVPWEFLGKTMRSKVEHNEIPWPVFAEVCINCTEDIPETDNSRFNPKKYLIEISRKAIVSVNGQPFKPDDPYRWKHEFGIGLMDIGIIPRPQFGGGESKNQSEGSTQKKSSSN